MRFINVCLYLVCFVALQLTAKEYVVADQQSFADIASNLKAGDTVILKNGVWNDFEILFKGKGTAQAPITLTAETKGKVVLSGQSNLSLAGEYLVVSGLVFKNGYTPSSAVIEYRHNKQELAYHSRVTETVIDNFSNPDKTEADYWVALYGKYNRFDHNHLVGKRNKGVTVAVRLDTEQSQQNHHRIDHNYFGHRPTFGSNGGETLRIGTSHYSLTDSHTLVENNYFDKTNGEVEIVSIKSGKNTVRGNLFFEAQGTLTMRHGNDNIIEENVFFGNGVEHTGGIRVINKGHTIRNNYLEGLTGYRFGSGFTVMNGVPNSPINRYHQVDGVTIENNTFVDVRHIQLGAGSDTERSAVPVNSQMNSNLIINQDGQQPFTAFDDVTGLKFADNLANTRVLPALEYGVKEQNVTLTRNSNGLLRAENLPSTIGASQALKVLVKEATGVTWYPKSPAIVPFDSGKTHTVNATGQALINTINNAQSGDILELTAGQYDVAKLIEIDKTLTIKARQKGKVRLTYQRSTLFEIHDGGSLKLDGLLISGASSPDYSGNSVVRTKKWGMIENYRFVMSNSEVVDMDVNHSYHFFVTGKIAFADEIRLENNRFDNLTGDILRLDAELEDLGVYNAEYVTLIDNRFNNVQGALIKLYRGGSDESTFGPHLLMENNTLNNVGLGKRNKHNASVYLHGVQVTEIVNNEWSNSAPVIVEHTVGEPKTVITDNLFKKTAAPNIAELRAAGPHSAKLSNNQLK
jgi:poly(beta-D-mannuronate) lyase